MSDRSLKYPRIKELREDRDLNQKDIAELLNCSQSAYSLYESGKRNIPTDLLVELSFFYGCSTDYLLGVTNDRRPYKRAEQSM